MKINGNKPPESKKISLNIQEVAKPGQKKTSAISKKTNAPDRVEISEKAKALMAIINQMPDTREDKIKALKKAIESGDYNIDIKKIAGKILEEI